MNKFKNSNQTSEVYRYNDVNSAQNKVFGQNTTISDIICPNF